MNCRDCQDLLQRCLDEGRWTPAPEMREHLRECAACRRDVAAARVLRGGLAGLSKPESSTLRTASITAAVGADRRARRQRSTYRWYATAALAACLMLLLGMGSLAPLWKTAAPPLATNAEPTMSTAELAQRADDAQKAVASLTRSMTENTKRFNVFLPDAETLEVSLPPLPDFAEPLDPAAESLRQAGLSMAHSLDPIAQTTVRAFDFFAREMPALDFPKN